LKRWCKSVALLCAVLCGGGFAVLPNQAEAAVSDVKVQVNDGLIAFPDAQPFLDGDSRLMVPVRFVTEKLGFQVEGRVDRGEAAVIMKDATRTVQMKTGESQAYINGNPVSMGGKAVFVQGRVFVPLRFVTDTFGIRIRWDNENRIAIVEADGKTHAPAWHAPRKQEQILSTAGGYLGVPYVWGGTTPGGFDCSGFVQYVFGIHGIELPRTSREMYEASGSFVTDLKPGDLVFFAKGSSTSHVGIYLGNNRFISATSSYGVHVDSLSSNYWGPKYIGAKRVL
jgi:peptidoglycan endopeptidase LytE